MANGGVGTGVIGLVVAVILVFSVGVPIIKDTVGGTANLTTTETTIAGFITLFAIVGILVFSAQIFGLL